MDGQSWSALGSAPLPNGEVRAIAYEDGKTYVGGTFVNAGGNAEADYLAVWDGASWEPFCNSITPPTFTHNVDALQVIDGTLFVGGEFQDGADIPTADYLLACDLSTGESSSLFATDGQFSGPIYALTANSLGTLYAGGVFNNLAEIPGADNVAAYANGSWHAVGATDAPAVTGIVPASTPTAPTSTSGQTPSMSRASRGPITSPAGTAPHGARWAPTPPARTAGSRRRRPSTPSSPRTVRRGRRRVPGCQRPAGRRLRGGIRRIRMATGWVERLRRRAGAAEIHALQIYQRHLYAGGKFTAAGGDSRARFLATYPLLLADNAISQRWPGVCRRRCLRR